MGAKGENNIPNDVIGSLKEALAPKCDWEVVNDFSGDHLPIIQLIIE